MKKNYLSTELISGLHKLYENMEAAYNVVSKELNFTCNGCPDNCCDSFFQHHTSIEWAYLWHGLLKLPQHTFENIKARAKCYNDETISNLANGIRPQIMCPLNDAGLCSLYQNRLMICRMHGVPAKFTRPDGRVMQFPGCHRCQEITTDQKQVPEVDRTELYRELAKLEQQLIERTGKPRKRIKMTIAEMILEGPPEI